MILKIKIIKYCDQYIYMYNMFIKKKIDINTLKYGYRYNGNGRYKCRGIQITGTIEVI